ADAVVVCVESREGARPCEWIDLTDTGEVFLQDCWQRRTVRTGADGSYAFASLAIGRWTVYAGRPGTPWAAADVADVEVEDGGQAACERDVRVAAGHVLRARLLDADGRPRRGARVSVVRAKSAPAAAVDVIVTDAADGDGNLEIRGL